MSASVIIGRPFSLSLVEQIAGLSNIQEKIARLNALHFLRGADQPKIWQLENSLLASTCYDSLPASLKRELHLRTAQAILQQQPIKSYTHIADLARHFYKADNANQALSYTTQMGKSATNLHANMTALAYYSRAQKLEDRIAFPDELLRWEILINLGRLYKRLGRYHDSVAVLRAAGPLASTGQLNRLRLATLYRLLADSTFALEEMDAAQNYLETAEQFVVEPESVSEFWELSQLCWSKANVKVAQGNLDTAIEECRQLSDFLAENEHPQIQAMTEMHIAYLHQRIGQWMPALTHSSHALTLYKAQAQTAGIAHSQKNIALSQLAIGKWDTAHSTLTQAMTLHQTIGQIDGLASSEQLVGTYYFHSGQLSKAVELLTSSVVKSTDNVTLRVQAQNQLALALAWQGQLTEAEQIISQELVNKTLSSSLIASLQTSLAEVRQRRGLPAEAFELANAAALLAEDIGEPSIAISAWLQAAQAALGCRQLDEAQELLIRAQEMISQFPTALAQAKLLGLAWHVLLADGQIADAKVAYGRARTAFTDLGANLYLDWLDQSIPIAEESTSHPHIRVPYPSD